uniref:UDP-N-acetylmuramate dehydrogenase n=1 Tax=Paulinella micropora TaxID=1928728 RepID=A0A385I0A6_9EUKA|nr:UDP-N-acetylenolpyruvoylglucosamine reductase [Paulinella micropora]AXY63357.1 UDP-N-acetylenolpyruvoylglucosamine reductase [Paulinella micropora]
MLRDPDIYMKNYFPKLRRNISLSEYCTWKIGGTADLFAEPTSLTEMVSIIAWANQQGIPLHLLGAGSNILISDHSIEGLTLCTRRLHGIRLDKSSGWIEARAGEPIPSLVRKTGRAGLSGLEWAVGIPGTVGGAVVMNAGAHNSCIADNITEVVVIDPRYSESPFTIPSKDLNFSYRYSSLQKDFLIVLAARFRLTPGFLPNDLLRSANHNLFNRRDTQPYKNPSCGSVFQNPEGLKTAILIEELGLKGTRIGGAQISTVHGNFIINTGGATAADVRTLMLLVQRQVQTAHNIILHSEVKLMGRFPSMNH